MLPLFFFNESQTKYLLKLGLHDFSRKWPLIFSFLPSFSHRQVHLLIFYFMHLNHRALLSKSHGLILDYIVFWGIFKENISHSTTHKISDKDVHIMNYTSGWLAELWTKWLKHQYWTTHAFKCAYLIYPLTHGHKSRWRTAQRAVFLSLKVLHIIDFSNFEIFSFYIKT